MVVVKSIIIQINDLGYGSINIPPLKIKTSIMTHFSFLSLQTVWRYSTTTKNDNFNHDPLFILEPADGGVLLPELHLQLFHDAL